MTRQRRVQRAALPLAAGLVVLALVNPSVPMTRRLWTHLVVLDITQSMDVRDEAIDGKPVARAVAARTLLHRALLALPCGSRVGLAVFTEHRSMPLYAPVEVCAHLDELRGTLAHIEGRMAWAGDSEIAKGVHSAWQLAKAMPDAPTLLFITDGHEAPPLDGSQRPRFDGSAGAVQGRLLGIGGDRPQPIPRSDPQGRPIGTWAADAVAQEHPHRSDATGAARHAVGATPGSEHLSSLRPAYLQLLAGETGLGYARIGSGAGAEPLERVLTDPALARDVPVRQPLRTPLALLALAALVAHVVGSGRLRAQPPSPRTASGASLFQRLTSLVTNR